MKGRKSFFTGKIAINPLLTAGSLTYLSKKQSTLLQPIQTLAAKLMLKM